MPLSKQIVNGFEVDFCWPELRLVVETDGLTYQPGYVRRRLAETVRWRRSAVASAAFRVR